MSSSPHDAATSPTIRKKSMCKDCLDDLCWFKRCKVWIFLSDEEMVFVPKNRGEAFPGLDLYSGWN